MNKPIDIINLLDSGWSWQEIADEALCEEGAHYLELAKEAEGVGDGAPDCHWTQKDALAMAVWAEQKGRDLIREEQTADPDDLVKLDAPDEPADPMTFGGIFPADEVKVTLPTRPIPKDCPRCGEPVKLERPLPFPPASVLDRLYVFRCCSLSGNIHDNSAGAAASWNAKVSEQSNLGSSPGGEQAPVGSARKGETENTANGTRAKVNRIPGDGVLGAGCPGGESGPGDDPSTIEHDLACCARCGSATIKGNLVCGDCHEDTRKAIAAEQNWGTSFGPSR